MAKKTVKPDVIIRVTAREFLTISSAVEICRSVARLDEVDTFAEFEARMDRLIESAKGVRDSLDGRTVHFVDDGANEA